MEDHIVTSFAIGVNPKSSDTHGIDAYAKKVTEHIAAFRSPPQFVLMTLFEWSCYVRDLATRPEDLTLEALSTLRLGYGDFPIVIADAGPLVKPARWYLRLAEMKGFLEDKGQIPLPGVT